MGTAKRLTRSVMSAAACCAAVAAAADRASAQATDSAPAARVAQPVATFESQLAPVVVDGHYDDAVGTSDAASQGAVTSRLLRARPALRPAEVLEFVPGVIVTQHSGEGKANQYFLRGFNLDHGTDFATSVAGVPVNLPTHAHGHGYTDLNFLIPELIERVEFRKGPYYAADGDFASAGSADIRLFRRLDAPIGQLTIGENAYRRLFAAASPRLGDGHLLIGVDGQTHDGPWLLPQDARRLSTVLRYSAGTSGDGYDVTLLGYGARWTATDQIPRRAVASGTLDRFGTVDPTDGGRTSRYSLSANWRARVPDGRVELTAWALRYSLNLYSNFTYFLDRPDTGDQFEQSDRRDAFGLHLRRSWQQTLGGMPALLTIGTQLRNDRIDVGLFDTQARRRLATTRFDRVDALAAGVYAEHLLTWSSVVRTVAGLRVDHHRNEVASNIPVNSGKRSDTLVSPKLSTIFTLAPNAEAFVNWGRGFHSNDARGTVTRVDPRRGEAVDPVPTLVRSTGYEVGLRFEPAPRFQTSVALWQLEIGSELVFVGDAGTTEPSRPSRRRGVEVNARWIPRPWLLFDLDLAASRARFADADPAGPFIPGAAARVASLGAAVRDVGRWSGSLQLRYLGARPLIEDGSVRSASSTLTNLRVGYRVSSGVDLLLDVFNVFDRRVDDIAYYYASRLPGEPPGGIEDVHFHPAEPRTFRVSLRARF